MPWALCDPMIPAADWPPCSADCEAARPVLVWFRPNLAAFSRRLMPNNLVSLRSLVTAPAVARALKLAWSVMAVLPRLLVGETPMRAISRDVCP
ncbi:hypothetical protein D3C87_1718620 [compost metagenome]